MSINPITLPEGAFVHCLGGRTIHALDRLCTEVTAVYVPVPEGVTYADAVTALADAGAWVEVETVNGLPHGARMRNNWRQGDPADDRTYVHRDDLPPTDPDADLIEAMARAMCDEFHEGGWGRALPNTREKFSRRARAALTVVREHEATR